ncbi:MAG: type II toxin-antitoxin system prevent-host-death family antitoxin [Deltaproteobacteria bacterium]|nr:type II toxin-antitoxin system prevent-host-death family antitoxin [Deltaproteobacteria bacterium]
MITIAVGEFKSKCLSLLEKVKSKKEKIIITKYGVPIAQVIPLKKESTPQKHKLRGSVIFEGDIISPTGEEWEVLK